MPQLHEICDFEEVAFFQNTENEKTSNNHDKWGEYVSFCMNFVIIEYFGFHSTYHQFTCAIRPAFSNDSNVHGLL